MRTHTDEWGGYSKPNWTTINHIEDEEDEFMLLDTKEEESLCKLVGIDLDQKVREILMQDA